MSLDIEALRDDTSRKYNFNITAGLHSLAMVDLKNKYFLVFMTWDQKTSGEPWTLAN